MTVREWCSGAWNMDEQQSCKSFVSGKWRGQMEWGLSFSCIAKLSKEMCSVRVFLQHVLPRAVHSITQRPRPEPRPGSALGMISWRGGFRMASPLHPTPTHPSQLLRAVLALKRQEHWEQPVPEPTSTLCKHTRPDQRSGMLYIKSHKSLEGEVGVSPGCPQGPHCHHFPHAPERMSQSLSWPLLSSPCTEMVDHRSLVQIFSTGQIVWFGLIKTQKHSTTYASACNEVELKMSLSPKDELWHSLHHLFYWRYGVMTFFISVRCMAIKFNLKLIIFVLRPGIDVQTII